MTIEKSNNASDLRNEAEAAQFLKISKQTLIRLRKAGRIGYYRIAKRVLYGQEHLESFLSSANQQNFETAVTSENNGGQE